MRNNDEYCVYAGKYCQMHYFSSPFEAENFAEELSEKKPTSNIYIDIKGKDGFYYRIAKFRDGIQVCRYTSFDSTIED